MTNISKAHLDPLEEKALLNQLAKLFAEQSISKTQTILNELLGHEEKIMIAKRFAVIALLWKKQSLYSIAQKLHVSTSTVTRIETDYHNGRYDKISSLLNKPSLSFLEILNAIDNILHLGGIMPHYGQTHASEAFKKARARRNRKI